MTTHMDNRAKPVELDTTRVLLGPEGVEDFCWPVGYHEVRRCCLDALAGLAAAVRSARRAGLAGHAELMALASFLAADAMGVFQGQALVERLRREGRVPLIPEHFRIWPALMAGQAPAAPPLFPALLHGFAPRTFGEALRRRWEKLTGKGRSKRRQEKAGVAETVVHRQAEEAFRIHARRLSGRILRHEIVTTKRGDIQSQHAAHADCRVTLAPHKFWFRPLRPGDVAQRVGRVLSPALRSEALDLFAGIFGKAGLEYTPAIAAYFAGYLDQGTALLAARLDDLRSRPRLLPNRLWTGTCGNVWDRLLRMAVRERGGRTTGHSHAGGFHHRRAPEQNSVEFLACDEFIVYNESQVRYTLLGTDEALLFEGIPEVRGVPGGSSAAAALDAGTERLPQAASALRRIMYVSCLYLGERQAFDPPVADLVAVDFQVRLFRRLADWGYEVLYKPHPETDMPPPTRMEQATGAKRLDAPFEAVLGLADLYLFDNTNSTTFKVAAKTAKPIVYVDTGTDTWSGEAYEQLGRRCAVVRGRFDAENRIRLDWDELRAAVARAPELAGDTTFVRTHVL
jgi:hypothetical protein